MKYFLHDSSSFEDEKITELYINFGYEGLGLFYTILKKLAKQEKPVKTDVLKHQLKVGKRLNKCWKFMEEIGLISSNNGETFAVQLNKNIQKERIAYTSPKKWNQLRKEVFNRDNYTCTYCGSKSIFLECDHIVPFICGGEETIENLTTSCRTCNRKKKNKSVSEFINFN